MNFKGRIVQCVAAEEKITVQQAVVTDQRISLDWNQDGRIGYLIAKSTNGSHFQGRYGYQQEKSDYECELTLFAAMHEDLLYGTWREHDTDRKGTLVIRLPARTLETRQPQIAGSPGDESAIEPETAPRSAAGAVSIAVAATPETESVGLASPAAAELPSNPLTAISVSSAQVDHLLSMTAEQFGERDRLQIEQDLLAAPVSALFKLAHNALAADLRAMAARMFADRYGTAAQSSLPARAPRRTESPEMRAQKRRSSRHGRSR